MIRMKSRGKRLLAIAADRILAVIAPLIRSQREWRKPVAGKRILLIRCDHIGDAIMATSVLSDVREQLGAASLDVLCGPWAAPIFDSHPAVDRVLVIAAPWWVSARHGTFRARFAAWISLAKAIRQIRRARYDIGIELRGDLRQILFFLALGRVARRVSSDRTGGRHLLTDVWRHNEKLHEVEKNAAIVALLDVEPRMKLDVSVPAAVRAEVETLRERSGLDNPFVVLSLRGTEQNRGWPIASAARLAEMIRAELGALTVLIGGPADRDFGLKVQEASTVEIVNLCGTTTLLQSVALLKCARAAVVVDSGPMHMAAAARVPTVALFGSGDPRECRPWCSSYRILSVGAPCGCQQPVCDFEPNGPGKCMYGISPEAVIAALHELTSDATSLSVYPLTRGQSSRLQ